MKYDTLDRLFDQYDAFLIDQFGVMMSGNGPYTGASEALARLATFGKPVIILSNSGKRSTPNIARLVRHGFDRSHFDTVLTSGEVAHTHIASAIGRSIPPQARMFVIIKENDIPPIDGLDVLRTHTPENADMLLIVSRDPARSVSSYQADLARLAERKVPGLCVNPDLKMLTPKGMIASAGKLGQIFEKEGGQLRWFGKPHSLIYDRAKTLLGEVPSEYVLCIGDSLAHDITGGSVAGFKTALVRTGVHADSSDGDIQDMITAASYRPDHLLSAFT